MSSWFKSFSVALSVVLLNALAASAQTLSVTNSLSLWLKADVGVTTNSSGVTLWADQSGNRNDATQSHEPSQPQWIPNELNGLPVVRFDGNNDALVLAEGGPVVRAESQGDGFVLRQGKSGVVQNIESTIFVVYDSHPSGASAQNILARQGDSAPYPPALYHGLVGSERPGIYWGSGPVLECPTAVTNWNIVRFELSSASVEIAIGDSAAVTAMHSQTNVSRWTSLSAAGCGQDFKGAIAEVLIYNQVLPATDRQHVYAYLRAKYALPDSGSAKAGTTN